MMCNIGVIFCCIMKLNSFQALHSLAKCVAAIALTVPGEALNVPRHLVSDPRLGHTNQEQVFNMYTLGEIGRHQ
jgi:cullin-associated NEDD8-dissociated protein 1